jgi:hypothetical protein
VPRRNAAEALRIEHTFDNILGVAGGMNRRSTFRQTLHERIHGTPPPADPEPAPVRHCWVSDEHGRRPGLLLEWRRTAAGWQGRVLLPVRDGGMWVVAEEWLSAELLSSADP